MRYLALLFIAAFLVLNEPINPVAPPGDQVASLDVADITPSLLSTSSLPIADACCIQPIAVDLASGEPLRDFKPASSTSIKTPTTLDKTTASTLGTGEPLRVWDGEVAPLTHYLLSRQQATTATDLPIYLGREAVGRRLS